MLQVSARWWIEETRVSMVTIDQLEPLRISATIDGTPYAFEDPAATRLLSALAIDPAAPPP